MSGDEGVVIPLHGGPTRAHARVRAASVRAREGRRAAVHRRARRAGRADDRRAARRRAGSSASPTRSAFLRRRLEGDYEVDEYGFDRDFAETVELPALRALYERWFRVEVNGIENVPATGARAAGGQPRRRAVAARRGDDRGRGAHRAPAPAATCARSAADLLFGTPGLGTLARRGGATLACQDDAERLLRAGELVGVWPEGFKGIGKPYRDRYRLRRFGRGGFVRSAIAAGVPIVPVSIVGSEEIHPMLGNARTLARLLNLPYFPLTPTFPWLGPLGLVPLPSKWYIEFGAPMRTDELAPGTADDPRAVFELTDQVRDRIQTTLYRLLAQRGSVWR